MNRCRKFISRIAAFILAASMAVAATSCGSKDSTNGTVAVIAKSKGVQFWDYVKKGAEDAGEELNYKVDYFCPENETQIDEQINFVKKAIDNKVKAIVIAPIDTNKLNDCLRDADNAGITVITIDSAAGYSGIDSFIGSDNTSAGSMAGREAAGMFENGKAKYAIIGTTSTSISSNSRIAGFETILKSFNKTEKSSYESIGTQFCDGDQEKAKDQAMNILKEHDDVDLIYATNEKSTVGVCEAVDEMGKSGKVKVLGFNSNDAEIGYINSGTLTGTIIQAPYNMGYLGVRYADNVQSGKKISQNVDTGTTFVSKDNINEDEIQLLLNPMGENK